jgi:hypothetical protein
MEWKPADFPGMLAEHRKWAERLDFTLEVEAWGLLLPTICNGNLLEPR